MQEKRLFWWFVLVHCTLWIIMPTLMRYALPHDTIEGALWGQHLEWGYDKNPWMNAWLTRLGWEVGGTSGIGIYFLSSLFVGISFWSVWELAKKFLTPINALVSVLILEACINYTLVPQSFNDNCIELGLWPLMFLFFYNALETQKIKYWLLTGIIAGFAMMAKYYTAIPLIIMAIYARKSFASRDIYIGFLGFLLICLPHIIWLFQHDFLTIKYAFNRAGDTKANYLNFAYTQILDFLLPIIILFFYKIATPAYASLQQARNDKSMGFIYWMSLGPFLLTVLLAMIFGWHLYNEWGVPLVTLWGILLVSLFNINFTEKKFKIFLVIIYIIMFLWAIGYAAGLLIDQKRKHSDNYPAQDIANYVTQQWWDKYHKPLKYIAGSRYVGGYITFYSKDHPSVFVEWEPKFSEWIDIKDLKKYGAVFIQDDYYGTTVFGKRPDTQNGQVFPQEVLQQYPNLIILPVKYFKWYRSTDKVPKIPVLIGFLPPDNSH